MHVYDVFFVNGLVTEVVQTLVPCLQQNASDGHDVNYVHSNTERYEVNTCIYAQLLKLRSVFPFIIPLFLQTPLCSTSCT